MKIDELKSEISTEEYNRIEYYLDCGQIYAIEKLPTVEAVKRFIKEVDLFDQIYPHGLKSYIEKTRDLLEKASKGENPLEGWIPSVPPTIDVTFNDLRYHERESEGLKELVHCGFILVAGGLGERLGYDNIKVSLPTETFTDLSYLGYYIGKILAIQHRAESLERSPNYRIPFAIMTSDNNHEITLEYLRNNQYFGMAEDQVYVMKQDTVPSVINLQGELAVNADGTLIRKPHGHGDVHFCLYRDRIAEKWYREYDVKHLFFFQDTNALSFYTMTNTASICKEEKAHMISTCVKRKPHEASGALCKLTNRNGEDMTCNVEYNQLEDVIRVVDSRGDYADELGYSPFPGNGNILYYDLKDYLQVLEKSKGIVPEFVNPKYKKGSMTEYQQPTRLESMMQDYPKLIYMYRNELPISNKHIVVTYPRFIAWSPVKNNKERAREMAAKTGHEESPKSGEKDILHLYKTLLLSANSCCKCNPEGEERIVIEEGAYVILGPECGCTTEEIHSHIGKNVVIKKGSVVVIQSRFWHMSNVTINGCLIIRSNNVHSGEERTEIVLEDVQVCNKSWKYRSIEDADTEHSIIYRMRGYVVDREEQCEICHNKSGVFKYCGKVLDSSLKLSDEL